MASGRAKQMWRAAVATGLAASLAGCAIPRSYHAGKAKAELIGQTGNQIYACAGVPNRTATRKGIEYLTYENSSFVQRGLTLPLIGGGINDLASQYCVATFALRDDKVVWVGYTGDSGPAYAPNAQCDYIVRQCRELAKFQPKPAGGAPQVGQTAR